MRLNLVRAKPLEHIQSRLKTFSPGADSFALAREHRRTLSMMSQGSEGASGMILAVTLLAVTVIAVIVLCVSQRMGQKRLLYELAPDSPHPFGYEMSWIAVLCSDTEAVLDALEIKGETASNWNNGIGTVYDHWLGPDHVFVSPPVDGWTFVISVGLPHPVSFGYVDKCTPLLAKLAREFVDVQYYFSYPALRFFSWVRFRDGRLLRAFASTDEGVIWSKGQASRAEQALGLKLFEFRGVRGRHGDAGTEIVMSPTEEQVMQIARSWSRDPTKLKASDAPAALGYIAPTPQCWRAERLRKSAAA